MLGIDRAGGRACSGTQRARRVAMLGWRVVNTTSSRIIGSNRDKGGGVVNNSGVREVEDPELDSEMTGIIGQGGGR